MVGRIPQRLPQLVHGRVQALLKIDEGSPLPQMPLQLFAAEDLARLLEQNREDLQRLALKPDPIPEFAQVAREVFEFKRTEQNLGRWVRLASHIK